MKVCNTCHELKAFEAFSIDRTKRDGRKGQCRDCYRAYRIKRGNPNRTDIYRQIQTHIPAIIKEREGKFFVQVSHAGVTVEAEIGQMFVADIFERMILPKVRV